MKLAVIGSRGFLDYDLLVIVLDEYYHIFNGDLEIVSGGAQGADRLAEVYAMESQLPTKIFRAEWGKYGKSAGYRRNVDIIDYADEIVVFWDGVSNGTKHSINIARKQGKTMVIINYEQDEYKNWDYGRIV